MGIRKLLVANRAEIAARVIRTARAMDVATVAVYTDPDAGLPYVRAAGGAVRLPGSTPAQTYLNGPAIIAAALAAGADAIHPGYGFLSENADFAAACARAGLIFVGPPAEVIRLLGDKSAAKRRMEAAGVPVVPGYAGEDQSEKRLRAEAKQIGAPLLIKAAAGGGGRGMRVVGALADFGDLLDEARREALAAFGDDRVLLERYITRPRHIEFQIFGDTQGHVLHLFERECS